MNNVLSNTHAKQWTTDSGSIKFRYPETNLFFEKVDGIIYLHDIDDANSDPLAEYKDLRALFTDFGMPIDLIQQDFKDCQLDSGSNTYIYDVNTLQEV